METEKIKLNLTEEVKLSVVRSVDVTIFPSESVLSMERVIKSGKHILMPKLKCTFITNVLNVQCMCDVL